MDQRFHRVCRSDELAEGAMRPIDIDGWPVLVGRSGGRLFAVVDRCSHGESNLAGGRLMRGAIACPLHGALFNLATGACLGAVKYGDLRTFDTRQTGAWIEVAAPVRERVSPVLAAAA